MSEAPETNTTQTAPAQPAAPAQNTAPEKPFNPPPFARNDGRSPFAATMEKIKDDKPAEKEAEELPKREEPSKEKQDATTSEKDKAKETATKEKEVETSKDTRSKREQLRERAAKETTSDKTAADDPDVRADDPPRFRERIVGIKTKLTAAEKEAQEARAQLEKAQAALAEAQKKSTEIPPEVIAEREELQKFRRRFDLENDPEIKGKFDNKIADAEKTMSETLAQLPEWDIVKAAVEKAGGIAAFGRSKAVFRVNGALSSKEDGADDKVTAEDIFDRLLKKLPRTDAEVVRGMITEQARLRRDKDRMIVDETAKAAEYFGNVQKQKEEGEKARKARLAEVQNVAENFRKQSFEKYDYFKDVPLPNRSDKKAYAAAIEENKQREIARNLFTESITNPKIIELVANAESTEELAEIGNMLLDSTRVFYVERELRRERDRAKALEAEVKQLKDSSATTSEPGTTTAGDTETDDTPERMPGESSLAYSLRTKKPA